MKSRRPLPRQTRGRIGGGGLPALADVFGDDLHLHISPRLGGTPISASIAPLRHWAITPAGVLLKANDQPDPLGGLDAVGLTESTDAVPVTHTLYGSHVNGKLNAVSNVEYWIKAKATGRDWWHMQPGGGIAAYGNVITGAVVPGVGTTATSLGVSGDWRGFRVSGHITTAQNVVRPANNTPVNLYQGDGRHAGYVFDGKIIQEQWTNLPDFSGRGHHGAPPATHRPCWGEMSRAESRIAQFSGASSYLPLSAGPSGWEFGTSHTWAFLVSPGATTGAARYFLDFESPRLIIAQCSGAALMGVFDGAWKTTGSPVGGPQIILVTLNGATGLGAMYRANATAITALSAPFAYTPTAPGGPNVAAFGSFAGSSFLFGGMATLIGINRAVSDAELDYLVRYLRAEAAHPEIGWAL